MASGDLVTPFRTNFRVGDVEADRPVSEALFNKVAQETRFINEFQTYEKTFRFNGSFSVATGITYFDGAADFFYNSQITGLAFRVGKTGSSGITTFDLRYGDQNNVDQGSIFSTLPTISSSAVDGARGFQSFTTGNSFIPTGVTAGVFNKTEFLEGEFVYGVLTTGAIEGFNCEVKFFYRPIN